jgi:hypothetical protein
MLSAWSASFLGGMTRISREMNHRAFRERRRNLLPTMRLRLLPSHSFRHSRFALANRITSLLPTTLQVTGPIPALWSNPSAADVTPSNPRRTHYGRFFPFSSRIKTTSDCWLAWITAIFLPSGE